MPVKEFKLGSAVACPGSRADGTLTVPLPGVTWEIAVILVEGARSGPTVAITAGIHGAEYAGMVTAVNLASRVNPASVTGRLILLPCANLPAFYARSVYVNPLDGKNPNRVFPGSLSGTASEVMAATLVAEVFSACDYYIDLHGGDMIEALIPFTAYPITGDAQLDGRSAALARAFGIDLIVESATVGSTYGSAARLGRPAVLVEAGGQGVVDPAAVDILERGVLSALDHLGVYTGGGLPPVTSPPRKMVWLRSQHRALFYPSVGVGEHVEAGQKLGEMRDFYGRLVLEVVSPASGPVLFLVTSLASSPGDPVLAVGAPA